MGFGLKSMTVGKGNILAAILYTCHNQMEMGREWDCLFILCREMGFELDFWWEREGIGNHFTNLYFKMGIAPYFNDKYEGYRM